MPENIVIKLDEEMQRYCIEKVKYLIQTPVLLQLDLKMQR